jgi:hypothetical protein
VEECESQPTTDPRDMDLPYQNAIFIKPGTGGHSFVAMERVEHISVRNAKVGAPFRDTDPVYLDS